MKEPLPETTSPKCGEAGQGGDWRQDFSTVHVLLLPLPRGAVYWCISREGARARGRHLQKVHSGGKGKMLGVSGVYQHIYIYIYTIGV